MPCDVSGTNAVANVKPASRKAGDVERRRLLVAALGDGAGHERGGREPERDDEEEAPRPAQRRRDDPTEHETGDHADVKRRREPAERPLALALLPERRRQQRERRRDGERGADPLHRARRQQHRGRGREAGGERGEREDQQPGDEHAPPAVQVARAAADEQERA
jgi:hypothetical protein